MSGFIALMYHSLRENPTGAYSVSFNEFKTQLEFLKAEGFIIEGFSELELRLRRDNFPERYIVMSFDDGHNSDLRAAEMLLDVGAQATFFLAKNLSQTRTGFLNDNEIKELATLCSIGSHGVTHSPLTKMSPELVRCELAESKRWLEDLVGRPVNAFSAPGGYISPQVVSQALEFGYTLGGNSVEWLNRPADVRNGRVVNRVPVRNSFLMPSFKRIVKGDIAFLLKRRLRSKLFAIPKRLLSQSQVDRLRRIKF